MYEIFKSLTFLICPSSILIAMVLVAGVALLMRRSPVTRVTFVVSASLLLAGTFLPFGLMLTSLLEHRFPPYRGVGPVTGIVMLDGGLDRLPYDLVLARRYPAARIIYSGEQKTEGSYGLLVAAGLSTRQATSEGRSRDTFENAIFSKELAKPKAGETWLVVTSAAHMPRAMAAFRAVDFPVVATPVAFKSNRSLALLPPSEELTLLDGATREMIGLIGYHISGRTREFWPRAAIDVDPARHRDLPATRGER